MALIAGCLIGISLSVETLAFYFREFGSRYEMPTLGYSLHVQLATLARVGTLVGLPLLGWMLDHGRSTSAMVLAPAAAFATFSLISGMSLAYEIRTVRVLEALFRLQARFVSRINLVMPEGASARPAAMVCKGDALALHGIGAFCFVLTAGGLFGVMTSATFAPQYRATILQLTPLITSIGTVVSVSMFDPKVSALIDRGSDGLDVVRHVTRARLYGALVLLVISLAYLVGVVR
jgi:hypothetical protein